MKITILAVAFVILFGNNCSGSVLDQSYLDEVGAGGIGDERAQTFTPGITGVLTHVELRLGMSGNPDGSFLVTIRSAVDGWPVGTNLGAIALPRSVLPSQPNEYISLDFSSEDIHVTAGERMAIVVNILGFPSISWGLGETLQDADLVPIGGYAGGDALARNTSSPTGWKLLVFSAPRIGLDYNFKRESIRPN